MCFCCSKNDMKRIEVSVYKMVDQVVWKPIPEFEHYSASSDGRVRGGG
jgi:hypothetical protein